VRPLLRGHNVPQRSTIQIPENRGSADSHALRYRPDIDGLRAIAVLSVIFFHLTRLALPGGYLGVDMFFVLSGYLITSIIWREVKDGEFSVARFYDRRIRRIMPALLFLVLPATMAASLLLLPTDLIGYGKSLLATLGFVANIYFWSDTDYFSRAAEAKPLLHLWSLGVEEQFYIFFPLILAALARRRRRIALPAILLLTIGSLAANSFVLSIDGATAAFFLLPARAWELGFGAILPLLPARSAASPAAANGIALFAALLVILGIMHPALIPIPDVPDSLPVVVGTTLLIFAGQQRFTAVNRLLCIRPLVLVGLISYSLYLWHWPIIVFAQYYLVRNLNFPECLAALALMTGCAAGSWRFIERPFRSKGLGIRTLLIVTGAGTIVLAVTAALLIRLQGLPGRLNTAAATLNQAVGDFYRCPIATQLPFGAARACVLHLPTRNPSDADVVLLGNSHAVMYAPLWTSILQKRGQTGLLVTLNGCLPTVQSNISRACIAAARSNLAEALKLARARTFILGLTWPYEPNALVAPNGSPVDNRDNLALIHALDDLIDQLRGAGKQVILIGPLAEPGYDIASVISRQVAFDHKFDGPTFLSEADFSARYGAAIGHFEARSDIHFVRPDQIQCADGRCEYLIDGRSLFADSNHVAITELHRFQSLFEAALTAQP
jgi:peptidoglycan/LPS O-acetylase OafA/YrhL